MYTSSTFAFADWIALTHPWVTSFSFLVKSALLILDSRLLALRPPPSRSSFNPGSNISMATPGSSSSAIWEQMKSVASSSGWFFRVRSRMCRNPDRRCFSGMIRWLVTWPLEVSVTAKRRNARSWNITWLKTRMTSYTLSSPVQSETFTYKLKVVLKWWDIYTENTRVVSPHEVLP